jgi:hypothetical protein
MTQDAGAGRMRLGHAAEPDSLGAAEPTSVGELRAAQWTRLRCALRPACGNAARYRSCEAAGVHPDDCHERGDLARFPTTSGADPRGDHPFGMFAVPQRQKRRVRASSGTTGRPTAVGTRPGPRRGGGRARLLPGTARPGMRRTGTVTGRTDVVVVEPETLPSSIGKAQRSLDRRA